MVFLLIPHTLKRQNNIFQSKFQFFSQDLNDLKRKSVFEQVIHLTSTSFLKWHYPKKQQERQQNRARNADKMTELNWEREDDQGVSFKHISLCVIGAIKHWQECLHSKYSTDAFRSEGENDGSSQHRLCIMTEGRREREEVEHVHVLLRDVQGAKCQRCDSNEEERFTPTRNGNEREREQSTEKRLQQIHLPHTHTKM